MYWVSNTCNIFLTMECNNNCVYCTNQFHNNKRKYLLNSGEEWVKFIKGLGGVNTVIFSGGEPTLHPDFEYIIDNINIKTVIYSNGKTDKLDKLVPRNNITIDISLHWGQMEVDEIKEMLSKIKFKYSAYFVLYPEYFSQIMWAYRTLKNAGFNVGIKPFDGLYKRNWYSDHTEAYICNGEAKKVLCKTNKLPIAPNGDIYMCHKFLYDCLDYGILGNIFTNTMKEDSEFLEFKFRECNYYGQCNPCEANQQIKEG